MTHAADLPAWAALLTAFFLLLGSALALVGSFGFLRLKRFYDRMHAPTLGTTWGTGGIVAACIVFFSVLDKTPVLHGLLIAVFVTVTTPVTLMLLARAALYRDRAEGGSDVPPPIPSADRPPAADDGAC